MQRNDEKQTHSVQNDQAISVTVSFGYFADIITEHEANFNANDIRDFIDAFLWEMKERGGDDPVFNKQELVQYIRDLIDGGTGTTASTLCWSLLCFAKYPKHQEKIYEEIAATIGESGIPSIEHQSDMPYTCAFIQEIMRHRTVLPMGVLHKTTEDAVLNGYAIPKNTPILPNMWSVHYDPEYFENPREFRPERFINRDGKFIKSSHVIPFSLGSRHCLGEHLAKMELFIFLTAIVQKLEILPDPKQTPPSFFGGHINLIYEAPEFQAIFLER
ncbi:vitamin D 25-hydroxylase-like [Styela clava]